MDDSSMASGSIARQARANEPQRTNEMERTPMRLKLHHVNLCSTNVTAMDEFYRDVLDMETEPTMARQRIKNQGYPGDVASVPDGTPQFPLAEKILAPVSAPGRWSTRSSAAIS